MSSKLKPLDLTGAPVGFSGTIDFNQFTKFAPNNLKEKAHIWLFNESGCGLDVVFKASGNAHYLPAGGWGTFDVEPNDGTVFVTVTYILPSPPVSSLNAVYYAPGEIVPQAFTLGNSPIGIGGSVNTVGGVGNSIQNDGNVAGTSIVEATVSGDSGSAVTLTNDAVMVLGDGSHHGSLTTAGPIHALGGLIAGTNGSGTQLEFLDSTATPQNVMGIDGSNIVRLNLTPSGDRLLVTDSLQTESYLDLQTSAIIIGDGFTKLPMMLHGNVSLADGALNVAGVVNFTSVANANGGLNTNTLRDDTNGNTALDLSAGTGDVTMPHSLTVSTRIHFALGAISKVSFFSGTANGTGNFVNHGLGVVPDFVFITMTGSGADTCSFFYNPATMTTTQVFVFATNGVATARAFVALAVKL